VIKVKIQGIKEFKGDMRKLQRQLPFAMARTLTDVGREIKGGIDKKIVGGFDRPSSYFKNSMFSTVAKKTDLKTSIGLKEQVSRGVAPATLYKEHFTGLDRGRKPFEKALMAAGVLPAGWRAVPGKGLALDGNGNPKKAQVAEMLAAIKRVAAGNRMQSYQGKGKRTTLIGYFVVPVGGQSHLLPGIYRRINQREAIKSVFIFVRRADYQQKLDLEDTAKAVINTQFNRLFWANVDRAMKAAK
jgi:hypothetical protein